MFERLEVEVLVVVVEHDSCNVTLLKVGHKSSVIVFSEIRITNWGTHDCGMAIFGGGKLGLERVQIRDPTVW